MSLEMAHKVILPPKKNYIPQFLKQDINSYYYMTGDQNRILSIEILVRLMSTGTVAWGDRLHSNKFKTSFYPTAIIECRLCLSAQPAISAILARLNLF
jgi:hypothetical protein